MRKIFNTIGVVLLALAAINLFTIDFFGAFSMIQGAVIMFILAAVLGSMFDGKKSNSKTKTKKQPVKKAADPKIDNLVKQYFANQEVYPLGNGVYLRYSGIDRFDALDVLYNDEVICKVGEYYTFSRETYESIRIQFEKGVSPQSTNENSADHKTNTNMAPEKENKKEIKKETVVPKSEIENYMETIQNFTTVITNQEIINGLNHTIASLKNIDMMVKKTPSKESKLGRLNTFYLPSLVTILKNYDYLRSTNPNDPDFAKVETNLIGTIKLINEALNNISNSMNDEEILDINADMTVMESMLQQDGLVKKGSIDELK